MKPIGFLAAGLTLLLLGSAPAADDKANAPPLPGFPGIKFNASLLEPRDDNGKQLLKIVRVDYNADIHVVIFLLELQTDIGFNEKMSIDKVWYQTGTSSGPLAYFFDRDNVAQYSRELKQVGKLYQGKKGDRIRLILQTMPEGGFPNAEYMEVRRATDIIR